MFRRNFFGAGPWDGARGIPTVRLAGRPRLGAGGNGCVVPGSGERPVFQYNPTTKSCGVFWMDTSTAPYPDCVQAPPGYPGGGFNGWIPPGCMPAEAPAPTPTPTPGPNGGLPPGFACPMSDGKFTLVDYRDGSIIAENLTEAEFANYVSDVTVLPPGRTCDDDPRCQPICGSTPISSVDTPPEVPPCCHATWSPGQNKWLVACSAVDERGINQSFDGDIAGFDRAKWDALCAYVPPGGCPAMTTMIAGQCSTGAIACGDRLVEIDENSQPTGRILSESWNTEHAYEQLPLGVHMVNESDPRCKTPTPPTSTPPTVTPPTSTPPITTPPPTGPGPVSVAPPTQITPGASVPIVPSRFPSAAPSSQIPISRGPMPTTAPPAVPQRQFAPSMRPSCKSVPYKTKMFPSSTTPTRPDQFGDSQQWTS